MPLLPSHPFHPKSYTFRVYLLKLYLDLCCRRARASTQEANMPKISIASAILAMWTHNAENNAFKTISGHIWAQGPKMLKISHLRSYLEISGPKALKY